MNEPSIEWRKILTRADGTTLDCTSIAEGGYVEGLEMEVAKLRDEVATLSRRVADRDSKLEEMKILGRRAMDSLAETQARIKDGLAATGVVVAENQRLREGLEAIVSRLHYRDDESREGGDMARDILDGREPR